MRGNGGSPIAVSIFALVIGAVLVAAMICFAITFSGPPPKDRSRGLESIAAALRTGHQPADPGPALQISARATPPASPDLREDAALAGRLAGLLDTSAERIVVLVDPGPHLFQNTLTLRFVAAWRIGDRWRVVEDQPPRFLTHWHWLTLGAMLIAVALLALPTWWFARAISRPLREIAERAATARPGVPLTTLPAAGPIEVRQLSRAVIRMHDRLTRYAEGRTIMLAAIAHDLGTPLSRLAFWVEQLPDAARMRAVADIEEMRAMIAAVLRLARDEAASSVDVRIDLGSLLDSLVEDMAVAGAAVSLMVGPRAVMRGDPRALRRLFTNLIENALRFGECALLRWETSPTRVEVTIDDHGPGFDPASADRLFEPFVRGDPSRNRATGGTGLGLAIVRSIAEAHGGTVALLNYDGGGRVIVSFALSDGNISK
ncbi:HAMP domain-containing sensor histidine kinase [Sphingomonas sp. GC_Shp_3]|uniref:sensor histidine kinase n=1 Tax=Sphingomonas sp. GC_Shp_3 TaxID=2937383 RepID=UPI002269A3DC|nr:HAMP domain-containing sensor histidine kinase [Sphingomonas sp. GC_Shp_3]